jgi:hypothetical protein
MQCILCFYSKTAEQYCLNNRNNTLLVEESNPESPGYSNLTGKFYNFYKQLEAVVYLK